MKTKREPLPDFDPEEVGFNVKAARGYLFSAAQHMLEGMHEQNVKFAAAAVMTGSVEFAALMWMQTAMQSGVPRKKARETAEREFRAFLIKHSREVYEQPQEATN